MYDGVFEFKRKERGIAAQVLYYIVMKALTPPNILFKINTPLRKAMV